MKKAVKVGIFLVLFFLILAGGIFVQGKEIEANAPALDKYYTSVKLEEGDSLWTIAQRYCEEGQDIRQYVEELQDINHIVNERNLRPGSYITVYYLDQAGKR